MIDIFFSVLAFLQVTDHTNLDVLAAIVAGALTQLVVFSFTWGRMSEKVSTIRVDLDDHEDRLRSLEGQASKHKTAHA